MKTVLLFSSFFYLLGLKLGNTIDILKRIVVPVKSIISAPAEKPVQSGKNYYFKPKATTTKSTPVARQANAGDFDQKTSTRGNQKLP
jgi:hypothetical protein